MPVPSKVFPLIMPPVVASLTSIDSAFVRDGVVEDLVAVGLVGMTTGNTAPVRLRATNVNAFAVISGDQTGIVNRAVLQRVVGRNLRKWNASWPVLPISSPVRVVKFVESSMIALLAPMTLKPLSCR